MVHPSAFLFFTEATPTEAVAGFATDAKSSRIGQEALFSLPLLRTAVDQTGFVPLGADGFEVAVDVSGLEEILRDVVGTADLA